MNERLYREAEERLWASFAVQPTERRLRLRRVGCTVRVQEIGDGPPLLFVHGASVGGSSWANLVPHLEGFRCLLLDRPGSGLSEPPTGKAGFADLAAVKEYADVLIPDVLDELGLDRAHIGATSYGGFFAFRAAAAHPDRIERIVEYSWPMGAPMSKVPFSARLAGFPGATRLMSRIPMTRGAARAALKQFGMRGALESGRFTPEMFDVFMAILRHTDSMRNELRASPKLITPIGGLNEKILFTDELLQRITMPVLFLWGTDDPNGGEDVARAFTARFPDAELDVMRGAGHAPFIDDADHAARATATFLRR